MLLKKMISILFHRPCATILVGLEGQIGKRYDVPLEFLPSILPVLKEFELEPKTDCALRIYCSTDFFDQILKALKNDIDSLSLFAKDDFRNLCCIAS
ncbi:hypothetical protein M5689_005502 [Euphorbia peplus]|nr:hypothetical protein M5689_005502 [Euphorbia peplus]